MFSLLRTQLCPCHALGSLPAASRTGKAASARFLSTFLFRSLKSLTSSSHAFYANYNLKIERMAHDFAKEHKAGLLKNQQLSISFCRLGPLSLQMICTVCD